MSFDIAEAHNYLALINRIGDMREGEVLLVVNRQVTTPEIALAGIRDAELCVSDYDDTMTLKGQYLIMGEHLMRDGRGDEDLADAMRVFHGQHVTPSDVMRLIGRSMGRLIESRLGMAEFQHAVQHAKPRSGVHELILSFEDQSKVDDPFVVVTSGTRDWVQAWETHYLSLPSTLRVHGLKLKWSKAGARQLLGCDIETMVCVQNKAVKVAMEATRCNLSIGQVMTVGDSPLIDQTLLTAELIRGSDGQVVRPGVHGVLLIGDCQTALNHPHGKHHMRAAFDAGVPMFLISPSLVPLAQIRRGEITA